MGEKETQREKQRQRERHTHTQRQRERERDQRVNMYAELSFVLDGLSHSFTHKVKELQLSH